MKKLKSLKLSAGLVLALIVGVLALGGVVKAAGGFSWANVESKVAQLLAGKVETPISSEDISVGAVTGPELPNPFCQGDTCIYTAKQDFIDATTTIISVPGPFVRVTSTGDGTLLYRDSSNVAYTSATTTVDLVRLNIPSSGVASTTLSFICGSATAQYAVPTTLIVSTTANLATSTAGVIENNVSSTAAGGAAPASTVSKIVIGGSAPWITCVIKETEAGATTSTGNTFSGNAVIRFSRTR